MLQSSVRALPQGVEITGAIATGYDEILSPDALSFIAKLHRAFESRRHECLQRRQDRQQAFDCGESLDFLTETKHIREGDWSCAPIPRDLQDRRVEITGPTDRKMVINARTAVLFVRPRGWHLVEKHLLVDGEPVAGAFFDFGLFFFHNAKELIARGSGPYFYLPKMESYLEARIWNDAFKLAQDEVGIQ